MTFWSNGNFQGLPVFFLQVRALKKKRFLIAVALLLLASAPGALGQATRVSLVDAYLGVAVFVAATLLLFYGAEKILGFEIGAMLRRAKWAQIPISSLMGAMPGCGGAIVVVAAYTSGNVRMGSVVAALTATMGDAAFLLIAKRPDAALVLLPLSFVVGIATGYFIELFDRQTVDTDDIANCATPVKIGRLRKRDIIYGLTVFPGFFLGVLELFQIDTVGVFGPAVPVLALSGISVGVFVWALSPVSTMANPQDKPLIRVTEETSFITIWVIFAFLTFEYLTVFAGLDLAALFKTVAPILPLIAIAVGLIPGCGPQVLVTTLYINGLIPFSALVGNAISNDGDALFPAIALNPRMAFLATVYSTIPAILTAYGFFFFAPGFL